MTEFFSNLIEERLHRLRILMKEHEVSGLLIMDPFNRRYFSGFEAGDLMLSASSGSLLITSDRQILLTDSRFTEAAKIESPLFTVMTYTEGLAKLLSELDFLEKALFFEPTVTTVALFESLTKALVKLEIKPLPFDLSLEREIKSESEIDLIRRALSITEETVGRLWTELKPGWTEEQAATFLDTGFRKLGAESSAFETIVATGYRGALPHANPGPLEIREGDLVVIDCGARFRGYGADITRTMIVGEPRLWQKEIYRVVRQAQIEAIMAIKPGLTGAEVDAVARKIIEDAGYGNNFGHGLGHGVGLAAHEHPSLSRRNSKPLKPGAVVTVEPGIYLPGQGGVRLEQMVLITENGAQVLNQDQHFYDF